MIALNKEFAREWITALRSGEYEQGIEFLRDEDNCFCCLGVACDLLIGTPVLPTAWITADENPNQMAYAVEDEDDIYDQYLPPHVAAFLGVTTDGAFLDEDREVVEFQFKGKPDLTFQNLAFANDAGVTFKEIAALLEDIVEGRLGA